MLARPIASCSACCRRDVGAVRASPLRKSRRTHPSVTDIFCAGAMLTAAGPLVGLVFLLMVIDVVLENVPNADTSAITVRGSPTPLLSVGVCTACTAIEYDSQPTPDTAHQVPPEIGFGRMRTRELAAMRSLDN